MSDAPEVSVPSRKLPKDAEQLIARSLEAVVDVMKEKLRRMRQCAFVVRAVKEHRDDPTKWPLPAPWSEDKVVVWYPPHIATKRHGFRVRDPYSMYAGPNRIDEGTCAPENDGNWRSRAFTQQLNRAWVTTPAVAKQKSPGGRILTVQQASEMVAGFTLAEMFPEPETTMQKPAEEPNRFLNHYTCPRCGTKWSDRSPYANNDHCPQCDLSDVQPTSSEDVGPS